ncbi:hypothetical protein CR970_03040 [Candidatus Saccharibacteria bacterium]|nr:MAG: hypothetical protein CR970_03040 [Candidatus Saccharibacteria bacterium]
MNGPLEAVPIQPFETAPDHESQAGAVGLDERRPRRAAAVAAATLAVAALCGACGEDEPEYVSDGIQRPEPGSVSGNIFHDKHVPRTVQEALANVSKIVTVKPGQDGTYDVVVSGAAVRSQRGADFYTSGPVGRDAAAADKCAMAKGGETFVFQGNPSEAVGVGRSIIGGLALGDGIDYTLLERGPDGYNDLARVGTVDLPQENFYEPVDFYSVMDEATNAAPVYVAALNTKGLEGLIDGSSTKKSVRRESRNSNMRAEATIDVLSGVLTTWDPENPGMDSTVMHVAIRPGADGVMSGSSDATAERVLQDGAVVFNETGHVVGIMPPGDIDAITAGSLKEDYGVEIDEPAANGTWEALPADTNLLFKRMPPTRIDDVYALYNEGWHIGPRCPGAYVQRGR